MRKLFGVTPFFGRREVACGFTGTYSDGEAEVDGTALVGKTSVPFHAKLTLKSSLWLAKSDPDGLAEQRYNSEIMH
jgi:hypothetical protein